MPTDLGIYRPSKAPGDVKILSHCPDDIARALRQPAAGSGLPSILSVARNSDPSGKRGTTHAVEDAVDSFDDLADLGIEARHLLPNAAELVEALLNTNDIVHSTEFGTGTLFDNAFVLMRLGPQLRLQISRGSGTKLDENIKQPHLTRVVQRMTEVRPALLWAKRDDRFGRDKYGYQDLLRVRDALVDTGRPCFIADGHEGLWHSSIAGGVLASVRGSSSSDQAKKMRKAMGKRAVEMTGRRMIDGQVGFGLAGSLPPGFARTEMTNRKHVLFLDDPACYPNIDEVADRLPEAHDAAGRLASQVENVRYFLRNFGRPGASATTCLEVMIARGYATQYLRDREGGSARSTYSTRNFNSVLANSLQRAITDDLDLYRTGVMIRRTGFDGEPELRIENCFPVDGNGWASEGDFERIERHLDLKGLRNQSARRWAWSTIPVTIDGVPAVLKPVRWS